MKVLKAAGIKPVQSLRIKPEKSRFQTETPGATALEISIPERNVSKMWEKRTPCQWLQTYQNWMQLLWNHRTPGKSMSKKEVQKRKKTRLPFGIISAPGYFQEIMDKLTCDLQGVAVYLDDILVGGSNSKEHLQNLKALLQRLRDKGMRCNKNKCIFAKDSIEYLGLVISKSGIDKGKRADALTNMPRPTNISTLRSFLGSVQFTISLSQTFQQLRSRWRV